MIGSLWHFFSRKFTSVQINYSTYDRELTAIHDSVVKYFCDLLEGRDFGILSDHKPLVFAFSQRLDKASPRQRRQLSFISQFSIPIEHLSGDENVVPDALFRVESIKIPTQIQLSDLAEAQETDEELKAFHQSSVLSLKLQKLSWDPNGIVIYCQMGGETLRPFIPKIFRQKIFKLLHDTAHPGLKVTDRIIRKRYVWPKMSKDIKEWCRTCIECQRSKVTRYTIFQPAQFVAPESRFKHVHMDIVGPLPLDNGYRYCLTLIDRFSRWPAILKKDQMIDG